MNIRIIFRWTVALLLILVTVVPMDAQYGNRGDKRYRERYSRANTYGDVVELHLTSAGTLEEKMPVNMMDRVRLLRIDGPLDSKDFALSRSCVSGRTAMTPTKRRLTTILTWNWNVPAL